MRYYLLIFALYFCSIQLANSQTIADFENASAPVKFSGTDVKIVENPIAIGNTSSKVIYYRKEAGNWRFMTLDFTENINIGANDVLSFKINSSTVGRVYVKLWNNATLLTEAWAPTYDFKTEANKWINSKFDLSTVLNKQFNRIEIAVSVDNEAEAKVYLDDFMLSNSVAPNGEPVIGFGTFKKIITVGETITFDASKSVDYDGKITDYVWSFQDGTTLSGVKVSRQLTKSGIYPVKFSLTDNDKKVTNTEFLVYVLPKDETIGLPVLLSGTAVVNKKIEIGFVLKDTYKNVYNPEEVKVDAQITQPDGKMLIVPCFFYAKGQYRQTKWQSDTTTQYWLLRFSASQVGSHKVVLALADKNGTVKTQEYLVAVQAGNTKGIIRIDAENKQYYRHQTGQPYYPLGINVGWNSTENYTTIINNLANADANLVRYWQVPFNRQALEWKNDGYTKGIGVFSQEAAAMQDSMFVLCEAKNMNLQLTLFQHGMFSENVNSNWSDNPYNAKLGGPLSTAEAFFYNDSAKKSIKNLLRYIVARWGYSPNLFAWELFNEVQFTGVHPNQTNAWKAGVLTWHDEMGKYLKSIDAFGHIVTTSADDNQLLEMDKLTGLDVVQYHLYDPKLLNVQTARDKSFLSKLTRTAVINGEYGLDITTADVPFESQRTSLWTGIMNQTPHLMWLWDNYTKPEWANLFKLPAAFLKDRDFVQEGKMTDWKPTITGNVNMNSTGFLTNKNGYLLMYDESNSDNITSIKLVPTSLKTGKYKVSFTNIFTGQITIIEKYPIISSLSTAISVPTFSKGIAIKFEYIEPLTEPVAMVEAPEKIGLGKNIIISAKNSYSLPNSQVLVYQWEMVEKPVGSKLSIDNSSSQEINIKPDVAGKYTFTLILKQGSINSNVERFSIIVSALPIANAGKDIIAEKVNQSIELDGSNSTDPEKDPLTYQWKIISAPNKSVRLFSNANTAKPTLIIDTSGEYLVSLVVNDGISDSVIDTVSIKLKEVVTANESEEPQSRTFTLYPNPTMGDITLDYWANNENKAEITIVDIYGKTLMTNMVTLSPRKQNKIIISMDKTVTTGVYLVVFTTEKGTQTGKIKYLSPQ